MKRKNRFFLFSAGILCIVSAAFIAGCSGDKKPEAAPASELPSIEGEETAKPLEGVILTEASLLELKADGKVHWKANLNAGDIVGWKDEKQDIIRAYDNQVRTFYRVDMDGDYWVQDYAVAGPAEAAVVVEADTVLYSKPDLTSPVRAGTVSLPRYLLAALLPDDNLTDSFVRVSARLEGAANPQISERYVKIDTISTDPNDVGAVKLARIAASTENPVVRLELLKNAMEMAGKGRRLNSVPQAVNYDPVLFELELTNNIEAFSGTVNYLVTSDTVRVRDMPSTGGAVLQTMNQGSTFWVSAQTRREVSLKAAEGEEPVKGVWLRLSDGGWVFSAYAVPNPAY